VSGSLRLHHVALGARDVAAVARFYQDVLGLPESARHLTEDGELRSVWLDLSGALLMIERTLDPTRRVEGVGAGPFLLAFRVSPDARAAFEQRVVAAGATIESRSDFSSYFRDPEGNRVAVSHYPDPA